jgi:adenosine deaminase
VYAEVFFDPQAHTGLGISFDTVSGLTVCPVSNRWVTDGLKAGELKTMLDRSLRATVNSDDPAYFGAYVNQNLAAAQQAAALTLPLERRCVLAALCSRTPHLTRPAIPPGVPDRRHLRSRQVRSSGGCGTQAPVNAMPGT